MPAPEHVPERPQPRPAPAWKVGAHAVALGIVTLAVYLSTWREVGNDDTGATTLLPYAILQGDGPVLDRFRPLLELPNGEFVSYVTRSRGHIVSLHPIGTALVAAPIELPQILAFDRVHRGWRQPDDQRRSYVHLTRTLALCLAMGKTTASVIGALVAVALFGLLRLLGLGRLAWPTALAVAVTTNLWAVASQALWQHGPAALALTVLTALLVRRPVARWRMILAGLAAAALVFIRPLDLLFAATAAVWVAWKEPRGIAWFLVAPVGLGAVLLAYNLYFFDAVAGGQAVLESRHPKAHGVAGAWTGDFREGALGTLVSPSRGLFVYTPWVALALATLPAYARRLRPHSIVCWMLVALIPYFLIFAKYSVWWGGHSFGPRYWIDVMPLFGILLGFALEWSWSRCRPVFGLFVVALLWALGVQLIGAYLYPSSWNLDPTNVDLHHERLWDWSDTELSRCLGRVWGSGRP
jgi:hypothetical protein